MPIHLPILASQSTIADYLDRETAQIDAMVDRKKHMVSLLNEALTSAALALVSPETFQGTVLPFRRIAEKLSRDCVSDGVVTAFRDGHVMLRSRRREDGFTESDTQAGYQGVIAGDVVFHGLDGFAGAIGVAEDAGICSPVYHVCRIRDGFDATYVGLVLRSMALAGHLQLQAGNVRERAVDFRNWDTLARMVLPVPPLNTQRMLASARTGRRVGTEALTAALDRQIAILRERRHALITAAVTGELGIPEVAA
jgi:type I restriction enzyme S subunit